jgi:arginine-tRNA-protein transferase
MNPIPLFLGGEHQCSYLPEEVARSAYVHPEMPMTPEIYSALIVQGFRRSGGLVYRPHCASCAACLPVRADVGNFAPTRSQMRILKRNQDLSVVMGPAKFSDEAYALFRRYLSARHADGGMAAMSRDEFAEFLVAPWGVSRFVEFRDGAGLLLSVAVVDELRDGLSAVYTFYSPDEPKRGLGTLAVLWQLAEARRRGLSWVYLGFWIKTCSKMSYKNQFRPFQTFLNGLWLAPE